MKQPKKIFTKMLLNNWGGISHKVLEFNEYVNLFCGKSGSGKSTVMDALQVVLYGSLASTFLNKAADDARNRRSVLSYLRGEQKDGTANRAKRDFCSQIVLELEDTGNHIVNCIGVTFEVGRSDQDVKTYAFFSHSGRIPENGYLTDGGVPFSMGRMRQLLEERRLSPDNRGRGDINRLYPSKEAYLSTLNNLIMGYIDGERFRIMEKSAISLRMTNGTGQFIRDYMFPKSKADTVAKISEQLGAYREIKERIDDLEKRIGMLGEISGKNLQLQMAKADIVKTERILACMEIQNQRTHLKAQQEDFNRIQGQISALDPEKKRLKEENNRKMDALIKVKAELQASDYGQKERELEEVERTILLLAGNSGEWRRIVAGLNRWEEDGAVTDYVSNQALQLIDLFRLGNVTQEDCLKLKKELKTAAGELEARMEEFFQKRKIAADELTEKQAVADELKNDRKPYPKRLREARRKLEDRLMDRYGKRIPVHIFADLFDIVDDEWKNAVEARLGRIKCSLITEPGYAHEAAVEFRRMTDMEEIDLIDSASISRDQPRTAEGSLYEAVRAGEDYVSCCLKRYLGQIIKCRSVDELEKARNGVTPDCYSYSNYMFRHLRKDDYTLHACIGTKVSKARLAELEEEIDGLKKEVVDLEQMHRRLKEHRSFEQLGPEPEQLVSLSRAAADLVRYQKKEEKLRQKLKELEDGSLAADLKKQEADLQEGLDADRAALNQLDRLEIRLAEQKTKAEDALQLYKERLSQLLTGYVPSPELETEVEEALRNRLESSYRNEKTRELEALRIREEELTDERGRARQHYIREYPSGIFSGTEKQNTLYDQELDRFRNDFEPKYKEEFQAKCDEVYISLRENVINSIHGEMKEAYRHKRAINRLLSRIRFSDSIYQIDILPAENENGQFYDMLMASELDSKQSDNRGFEGQMSLEEDEFLKKYSDKIDLLTEKFMPVRDADNHQLQLKKQETERYADYRNYLEFSMYEQTVDENGREKKNQVDEMAGRDSGGEGQNPKYVALLAGFAMLYMQQSNRDSRIRLVLLDEAFSKMDKERSEVCLRYARELELQLIVCVPDERLQSLIRNVDCVYGFRRHQNQISMMHIDKGAYLSMLEGEGGEDETEESRPSEREAHEDETE